jgi:plastocyanin
MAAGFGLVPTAGVDAAQSGVDVWNMPRGFEAPGATVSNRLDIYLGDSVTWYIKEGEHTVTPVDEDHWGDDGSGKLTPDSDLYTAKNFKKVSNYVYYCTIHGKIGEDGRPEGMWGFIRVTDPNATPPPPPPASTTTTTTAAHTTRPPTPPTTAPGGSSAGALTPEPTGPAPTTTKPPKTDKNKKPAKEEETTTTTTAEAPPAPVDIPDEAIVPSLPGSDTKVQEGLVEFPGDTPEGEAVALLKKSKRGGRSVKLLIASGIGLGVLGLGTAGYKFANRSSKYFPA